VALPFGAAHGQSTNDLRARSGSVAGIVPLHRKRAQHWRLSKLTW
jgi:hypothetical protein